MPANPAVFGWQSPCLGQAMTTVAPSAATPLPLGGAAAPASHGLLDGFFDGEDGGFSFHDLFSVVNPLQHIPIVSTLYRHITGDTIKPLARVAGDTLYGGWMGCISSVANIVFEKETGKDFGDTVLAYLEGGDGTKSVADAANTADTSMNSSIPAQAALHAVPIAPPVVKTSQLAMPAVQVSTSASQPVTSNVQSSVQPAQHAAPALRTKPQSLPPAAPVATRAPALLQSFLPTDDQASASLASSMAGANVDPEIAQRALFAYRRSLAVGAVASRDISPAL